MKSKTIKLENIRKEYDDYSTNWRTGEKQVIMTLSQFIQWMIDSGYKIK